MANKFKVKIPNGYLMIEEKGVESEYPGVFIFFSEDGKDLGIEEIIACVEYDSMNNEIQTVTYSKECDEPNHIIGYADGRNLMY